MHSSMSSRSQAGFDAESRHRKVRSYLPEAQYVMQSFMPQKMGTLHAATRLQRVLQRAVALAARSAGDATERGAEDASGEGAGADTEGAGVDTEGVAANAEGVAGWSGVAAPELPGDAGAAGGAGADSGSGGGVPFAAGGGSACVQCVASALRQATPNLRCQAERGDALTPAP